NPANPAEPGGTRQGPFFQFDASRLVDIHPPSVNSPGRGWYSYQDPYRNTPDPGNGVAGVYAYFSAYGRPNGYPPPGASDWCFLLVWPYADVADPADSGKWRHYFNPNSFQIIS